MSERKPGWYWVKMNCGLWTVALLCEGVYVSVDGEWDDENDMIIGPRIPSPNEPWQAVPVEPAYGMLEASGHDNSLEAVKAWQSMLAAAPKPENSQ